MKQLLAIHLVLILQGNVLGMLTNSREDSTDRSATVSKIFSKPPSELEAFQRTFKVRKDDSYKKLKFMEIIGSIRNTAKSRRLKIKKIELGSKVKEIFQNPDINNVLLKYINDKHFFKKLAFERKRYRKLKALQSPRNQQSKPSKADRRGLAKFNFDPKYAGMPFPPFLMNGPHYYPQTSITVNAVPNPYPRGTLVKEDLEIQAMQKQNNFLEKIRTDLRDNARPELDRLSSQALETTQKSRLEVARITQLLD